MKRRKGELGRMETKATARPDCFGELFEATATECKQCVIATDCDTEVQRIAAEKAKTEKKTEAKTEKKTEKASTKDAPAKKPGRKSNAISEETVTAVIAAVEEGKSYLAVAKEFGIPHYKIRKLCKDAGVQSARSKKG